MGNFIKADLHSSAQRWKKALTIHVDIDILQPLTSSVLLPCPGRESIPIEIRYERLSDLCYKCGLLGHKIQSCNASGDVVMVNSTCLFGPWLKDENYLSSIISFNKNPQLSSQNHHQ